MYITNEPTPNYYPPKGLRDAISPPIIKKLILLKEEDIQNNRYIYLQLIKKNEN